MIDDGLPSDVATALVKSRSIVGDKVGLVRAWQSRTAQLYLVEADDGRPLVLKLGAGWTRRHALAVDRAYGAWRAAAALVGSGTGIAPAEIVEAIDRPPGVLIEFVPGQSLKKHIRSGSGTNQLFALGRWLAGYHLADSLDPPSHGSAMQDFAQACRKGVVGRATKRQLSLLILPVRSAGDIGTHNIVVRPTGEITVIDPSPPGRPTTVHRDLAYIIHGAERAWSHRRSAKLRGVGALLAGYQSEAKVDLTDPHHLRVISIFLTSMRRGALLRDLRKRPTRVPSSTWKLLTSRLRVFWAPVTFHARSIRKSLQRARHTEPPWLQR